MQPHWMTKLHHDDLPVPVGPALRERTLREQAKEAGVAATYGTRHWPSEGLRFDQEGIDALYKAMAEAFQVPAHMLIPAIDVTEVRISPKVTPEHVTGLLERMDDAGMLHGAAEFRTYEADCTFLANGAVVQRSPDGLSVALVPPPSPYATATALGRVLDTPQGVGESDEAYTARIGAIAKVGPGGKVAPNPLATRTVLLPGGHLAQVDQDGWIAHDGKGVPPCFAYMPEDAVVEWRMRDGRCAGVAVGVTRKHAALWTHSDRIAYRIPSSTGR